MNKRKNVLLDKSFDFAIRIVNIYKVLSVEKKEFVLSKQLLRSGTANGIFIHEAQNIKS
ncbi:MAG: four helix bundle protein [Chitinophagales bacterium]|nr:four helix bundle protein [Chitinophagales bacterium]